VGFFSIAAQGLLFREHLRLYGGDEIGVGIFLAAWLLWIAIGSRLHGRVPGRPRGFLVIAGIQPLATLLAAWLIWRARAWAGLGPTEAFPPSRLLPLTLLALAPVSLATGWLIPAGARWLAGDGDQSEAVGRAWAAEALGGAGGGVAVTLLLVLGTTPLAILEKPRRAALPIPEQAEILETLDTPCTSWTAARLGDGVAYYGDGALRVHLADDRGEAWTAAALLAQRPNAREAGILGAGAEPLACRLLDAGLERVTVVVRDPAWPDFLFRHAPPALAPCLGDPRLAWRHGDRPPADAAWDLAWLQHTDPATAAAARFLSLSSIARIREALKPEGVLGMSISVTENILDGPALAYARAVDATAAAVFDRVAATGGERMLFLGSDGPVTTDAGALADRIDRGRGARLGVPGAVLSVGFEAPRMAARRARLDAQPGQPILAHRPTTHLLHLMVEGEASRDPLVALLASRGGLVPLLLLVLSLGVVLVWGGPVRRGEDGAAAPVALTAFGGGAAMAWQLVLLLAWQQRFGSLAAHFGVLSGVFMLGLWAGAAAAVRRLRRRPAGQRSLGACAGGLLGAGALLLWALHLDAGWLSGAALLTAALVQGLTAGTVVPVAAAIMTAAGDAAAGTAARLSVADHLGAVAATLATGLALVPTLGFMQSVLLGMACVAGAGVLGLLAPRDPAAAARPAPGAARRRRALLALILAGTVSIHQAAETPANDPGARSLTWSLPGGPLRITDAAPLFQGYEGPVSLYLDLDPDGLILDAKMGPHRETPAYVWGIDDWIDTLRGRRAGAVHLTGEGPVDADEVDAMTGATVTCRALLASAGASAAAEVSGPGLEPATWDQPLEAPPPHPDGAPRLHRKDAKQTRHQRDVNRAMLDRRIREGTLSDREADHYLPVRPGVSPE